MSSDYTYPWQQELLKAFDPDGDVDNVGLYNKFRASDQDHTMTQNSPISVSQNAQLVDGLAVLHGLPSDLKKAALEGRASSKSICYTLMSMTEFCHQGSSSDAVSLPLPCCQGPKTPSFVHRYTSTSFVTLMAPPLPSNKVARL